MLRLLRQWQATTAANSGVHTLCQALTLPLSLVVVAVLQRCKLDIYHWYFTEKWGSSRLSNLLKFMHPGRNKIGLWHLIPMTVPSVLPDWTKWPSSQKWADDFFCQYTLWQDVMLQTPGAKIQGSNQIIFKNAPWGHLKVRHAKTLATIILL